jgi:uncharacterized RDD family membrane protein YckC
MTPAENGVEKRVGFGARLAASLIDLLIVAVVGFGVGAAIGAMLGLWTGGTLGELGDATAPSGWAGAAVGGLPGAMAAFLVVVLSYSLIEGLTGASPGKRMLGLKVGTADGRAGSAAVYMKRWAVKYSAHVLRLLGSLPGLHLLGLLATPAGVAILLGCFLALGDKRQALHDIGAATAVFRKADLAP